MDSIMGKPKTPPVTPMPDSEALSADKKKKAAEIQTRSGRDSTILSDGNDRLGG